VGVEPADCFSELTSVELREVEQIVHEEGHHAGRRLLDSVAGLQNSDDVFYLFAGLPQIRIRFEELDELRNTNFHF